MYNLTDSDSDYVHSCVTAYLTSLFHEPGDVSVDDSNTLKSVQLVCQIIIVIFCAVFFTTQKLCRQVLVLVRVLTVASFV